jgi:eukaryotic-like serine/threonine-protein kinase
VPAVGATQSALTEVVRISRASAGGVIRSASRGRLDAEPGDHLMGAPDASDHKTIVSGDSEPEAAPHDANRAPRREEGDGPTMMSQALSEVTLGPPDSAVCGDPDDFEAEEELSFSHDDAVGTGADQTVYFRLPPETPAGRERAVPTVAGYEIEGELGRGGMGVVYRARQVRLNRTCALKMILAGAHANPETRVRFLAEAEVVARLQHPNVVQIRHIGEADGLPFFELEYLDGGGLDKRLNGTPWPARRAAELIEAVARGVAEAHRMGIVHRDLKPANILLTSDGTPKVTDFGVAKSLNSDTGLTKTDSIMGSPGYMAPEQAEGKTRSVGPLADVYALGAILYELLTGRPLFRCATALETLEQVKTTEPVPPSKLVPGVSRDLETIALKCLNKEPGKRYASAAALIDDLNRFNQGHSILARRASPAERTWRFCTRNPRLAAALASAALALVAVVIISLLYAVEQGRAKRRIGELATTLFTSLTRSNRLAGELETSLKESQRRVAALYLERGQSACEKGDISPGMVWIVESWRAAVGAGDAAWQHAARANLAAWQSQYPALMRIFPHAGAVRCAAFSLDGRTLVTASDDGTARLWDAATAQPRCEPLTHQKSITSVAFSPDGTAILTGSWDKTAQLWSVSTGRPIGPPLAHAGTVRAVALSPDGKTAATASEDRTARLWNVGIGQPQGAPLVHDGDVRAVVFSPDGQSLVTASDDRTARLWSAVSARPIGKPLTHQHRVVAVAFSPDGKTIITASWDKTARLWNAATAEPLGGPLTHQGQVETVLFSHDGKTVVTGCDDGTARIWNALTLQPIGAPMTHQAAVRTVAFSPDGKTILTGSVDGTARFWSALTGQPMGLTLPHHGAVWAATFSPDGNAVATGSVDGTARLWAAATTEPIQSALPLPGGTWSLAFSSDGKTVLTGGVDGVTRLWDLAVGKPVGSPFSIRGRVNRVAFSPDGKTVLTGGLDGTAQLWSLTTASAMGLAMSHQNRVNGAAFSPDGKTVATVSDDRTARLWDAVTGKPLGPAMMHNDTVQAVAFGPDDKTIVTGCWDKTAQVWEVATGKPLGSPILHQSSVVAVAFSPDGKTILTGVDGKAQQWDVATGRPVGSSMRHQALVHTVAFSPDGMNIVTGCWDKTARLWDATTCQPLGFPMRHQAAVWAVAFSRDGKSVLTGSTAAVLVWPTTEVPDDLDRVATAVEARTGLSLDASGSTQPLDPEQWLKRRAQAK